MRRIVSIVLAFALILSMTIVSFGVTLDPIEMDFKGATGTMTNSAGEDCYDGFVYFTGSANDVLDYYDPLAGLATLIRNHDTYIDFRNSSMMGYYESKVTYDHLGTPGTITFRIKPQIKGFNSSTEYLILGEDSRHTFSRIPSTFENGEIVFDYVSNGIDNFALVVNKASLDPNGDEPVKEGNEVHLAIMTALDKNEDQIILAVLFVRTNGIESAYDSWFTPITNNDAYYTLISASNNVEKDNLQLLERIEIVLIEDELLQFPVTLNISNSLINANTVLYPLHNRRAGEDTVDWEILRYTAGAGFVTLEFDSFSPVALYADSTTLNGYVTPVIAESPVTGDSSLIYVMMLGILTIVGFALVAKKETK